MNMVTHAKLQKDCNKANAKDLIYGIDKALDNVVSLGCRYVRCKECPLNISVFDSDTRCAKSILREISEKLQ